MRKKIQFIARTMLLLFLPAFVMRPVVVTVESDLQAPVFHMAQKSFCDAHQDLLTGHAAFRSIARENIQQVPVLSPCYAKTFLDPSQGRVLRFTSSSISFSPQGFHVLRI